MFIGGYVGSIFANMLAYCACSACQCASREVLRRSARVAWASLFFMAMIVAWLMRDFAQPLMEKIPWIVRGATQEDIDRYYGQQAVYRVSMGNFLFFSVMSVALLGVKYKSDKRDQFLHHGNWLLKLGLWLLFTALPFLFPNSVMDVYGWAARVGSGFFLVIQMVILLDFVQCWNDAWAASGDENPNFLYALMGLTIAAYSGALTLAGFLYHWFKPAGAGSCSLNILLITFSLLMVVVISVLSLHPVARNGSIFPAAMVGLYCMYLTASALMSEPRDYQCNGMGQRVTAASGSTLAGGMLFTLAAVVYAAFRAGSNTHLFTLEGSEDGETAPERTALLTSAGLDGEAPAPQGASREIDTESRAIDEYKPVTYNYSFFHLIFALASMYIAMLMTGWGSAVQEKDRIDVGWASVWVKTTAHWVTGLLYCWTLMAPAMFPDRDFA